MSPVRRLILVVTVMTFLLGVLAAISPVDARRPGEPPCDAWFCDPACRHACSNAKRINGQWCVFSGCVPSTGDCTYACPQGSEFGRLP